MLHNAVWAMWVMGAAGMYAVGEGILVDVARVVSGRPFCVVLWSAVWRSVRLCVRGDE